MKACTAAFKAHLAQPYQTTCTCWLVVRNDGTVLGFTEHDAPITYNLESYLTSAGIHVPSQMVGSGSQVYASAMGYKATDIASQSDLSTDNMEVHGPLVAPSITETALQQASWDFAFYVIFWVNWADLSNTMGAMIRRCGNLGQVTLERDTFKVELHGLTKAYTRNIGELTSETCRAKLFDTRCTVSPVTFTKTGTLTGVSADQMTLYDTGRTEPGPTGGVVITGITNANPGHVTTATPIGVPAGSAITIAGVGGMTPVNVDTIVNNPTTTGFDLSIDTTNTTAYPAYTSGGTATPLGANSGYFDNGVITFTGGLNNGKSMEVKSYVPGQWTLMLPMPLAIAIGDTYSMVAGCNKSFTACKTKFSNVANMQAEIYLPGVDKMLQVGKQGA